MFALELLFVLKEELLQQSSMRILNCALGKAFLLRAVPGIEPLPQKKLLDLRKIQVIKGGEAQ